MAVSKKILFYELCEMFEKIRESENGPKKQEHFYEFLTRWKECALLDKSKFNVEDSIYYAMRLIVPRFH